jgi:hypothetical protein
MFLIFRNTRAAASTKVMTPMHMGIKSGPISMTVDLGSILAITNMAADNNIKNTPTMISPYFLINIFSTPFFYDLPGFI